MNIFSFRYNKILAVLLALALILIVRLFVLTVAEHKTWSADAEDISTRTISTTAPRGEIYDRNGNLLAGNKQIFNVKMSAENMSNKKLNSVSAKLISVLDKNGDDYEDELPIKIKNGRFYYTYESEIQKWLKSENFPSDYTAEEAFYALAEQLNIDTSQDRYTIQKKMQNTYNEYPPISVTKMKYNAEIEKEDFLDTYGLKSGISAKKAFQAIRKQMKIDATVSDKKAREIMVVRNQIEQLGYNKYKPATIAKDVSDETVMTIAEEKNDTLKGVETTSETKRYYPNGSTACHILGYLGKISSDEETKYENKGYESGALIGRSGIEGEYESVLKGVNGKDKIQVNAYGEKVKEISKTEPKKGSDIYLTIDLGLQKTAESALKRQLKAIQTGGVFKSKYGNLTAAKQVSAAQSGAVVAIDVDSGEVLAMASYPGYNPNLFAEGISESDWESLQSDNPRDSLSPAPLYNIATQSAVQPGSTFKMVTSTAALECGLNPYKQLYDGGYIKIGNKKFADVLYNEYGTVSSGYMDLSKALEMSLNYYFYDISTGKDWYTGNSLGYKKKISVNTIASYAKQYGLGESTGIEIPEATGTLPSKAKKVADLKTSLSNVLYASAETYFKPKIAKNEKLLEKAVTTIVGWMGTDVSRSELINDKLPDVGVKSSQTESLADLILYTYFDQADWTTGDTFNIAIGQGENAYTPLQMANYVATLGNNGVHHKASLIESIENQGKTSKKKTTTVNVSSKKYFKQIIAGMKEVTSASGGSLYSVFNGFPVKVAAKTGTAQRAGYKNPKSEVSYIKQHLSYFDSSLSWSQVKKEMNRLMKRYPKIYTNENTAVRRAVINLSKKNITSDTLDKYKSTYQNFSWVVAMAPADDPKIAVAVLIVQGGTSANAGPVAREVIGKYLNVDADDITYSTYSNDTDIQ